MEAEELEKQLRLKKYTLEEILLNHENIANEILQALPNKKVLKFYDEFLNVGSYPFYFEDKNKYIDRIIETINTILHTDLSKLFMMPPDKIETGFGNKIPLWLFGFLY